MSGVPDDIREATCIFDHDAALGVAWTCKTTGRAHAVKVRTNVTPDEPRSIDSMLSEARSVLAKRFEHFRQHGRFL